MDNTTQTTSPAEYRAARERALGCDCKLTDVPVDHAAARADGVQLRTFTYGIMTPRGEEGDEIDVLSTDSEGAASHAQDIINEVYEKGSTLRPLPTGGSGGWCVIL